MNKSKYVGAHVSAQDGVSHAPINARAIGAEAFALFTRNPSRWKSKAISAAEADSFKTTRRACSSREKRFSTRCAGANSSD